MTYKMIMDYAREKTDEEAYGLMLMYGPDEWEDEETTFEEAEEELYQLTTAGDSLQLAKTTWR